MAATAAVDVGADAVADAAGTARRCLKVAKPNRAVNRAAARNRQPSVLSVRPLRCFQVSPVMLRAAATKRSARPTPNLRRTMTFNPLPPIRSLATKAQGNRDRAKKADIGAGADAAAAVGGAVAVANTAVSRRSVRLRPKRLRRKPIPSLRPPSVIRRRWRRPSHRRRLLRQSPNRRRNTRPPNPSDSRCNTMFRRRTKLPARRPIRRRAGGAAERGAHPRQAQALSRRAASAMVAAEPA